MNEPIERYFQIGLVSAMAYAPALQKIGWAGVIRAIAKDDFFSAVELNPLPDASTRAEIRAIAEQAHLMLCYNAHGMLFAGNLNPNALEEDARMQAERALCAGVEEAAALGSRTMGMLARQWRAQTREENLRQLIKTTVAVCRCAQPFGIRVELEVFDHDIAKHALLGPAPLAARFAQEVLSQVPNFGLMVDLSHIPMTYETPRDVLRTLRPYITHLHMGNTVCRNPQAAAYGDEHPRFGFPESSNDTAQLAGFLRDLHREGFFDEKHPMPLSFEVKPWGNEDAEVILANSKRVLHRAWAML